MSATEEMIAMSRTASIAEKRGQVAIPVSAIPPAKRALDVALSGSGLLLSAPIWAALATLIKLEDGGPVFFSQDRVGEGGRLFRAMKFRSMIPDAEARFGALQATQHDPRVTRIGRLMRATAMDELPQLWNIFRGDMSLVGPRRSGRARSKPGATASTSPWKTFRATWNATPSVPGSPASRRFLRRATFRGATSSSTTRSTFANAALHST